MSTEARSYAGEHYYVVYQDKINLKLPAEYV